METTDPMQDMRPPRELRSDEAWCSHCRNYFIDGNAYDSHFYRGSCWAPENVGMVADRMGAWGFPTGKDGRLVKRKRSSAEVSFERLLKHLMSDTKVADAQDPKQLFQDVERVRRELRRAKERRQ